MIVISKSLSKEIIETIDDCVEYICNESARRGELVSGETVYKVIHSWTETKMEEYKGKFNS